MINTALLFIQLLSKHLQTFFNFGTITGKIFKNNANVKMNDTIKEEYTNMLMDDSITGKSVTFEEFDEPNIYYRDRN